LGAIRRRLGRACRRIRRSRLICSFTRCSRAMSRCRSAMVWGRDGYSLWRAQALPTLPAACANWPESADAESALGALHAVDDAGAIAHQKFALEARRRASSSSRGGSRPSCRIALHPAASRGRPASTVRHPGRSVLERRWLAETPTAGGAWMTWAIDAARLQPAGRQKPCPTASRRPRCADLPCGRLRR